MVARAVTVFVMLGVRATGVLVVVFFVFVRWDKIVTGIALRGATVVFTALREVVERVFFSGAVIVVFFPRDFVFVVREAASALTMQTAEIRIKDRIVFISE